MCDKCQNSFILLYDTLGVFAPCIIYTYTQIPFIYIYIHTPEGFCFNFHLHLFRVPFNLCTFGGVKSYLYTAHSLYTFVQCGVNDNVDVLYMMRYCLEYVKQTRYTLSTYPTYLYLFSCTYICNGTLVLCALCNTWWFLGVGAMVVVVGIMFITCTINTSQNFRDSYLFWVHYLPLCGVM